MINFQTNIENGILEFRLMTSFLQIIDDRNIGLQVQYLQIKQYKKQFVRFHGNQNYKMFSNMKIDP